MALAGHFRLLAEYNRWMNGNLYRVAAELPVDALQENRGAYFGSIIGTLNHILVGDTIWLRRFSGHPMPLEALSVIRSMPTVTSLDQVLYHDLPSLRSVREQVDQIVEAFVAEANEAHYQSALAYCNMKGVPCERQFGLLVQHFFNHQTHHRGQVTTLLSQFGLDVGVTDLLARIPEISR